jgi:cell division protein FtsB
VAQRGRIRRLRRLRLGPIVWVLTLVVVAFLYARPLSTYLDTRRELAAREAEVISLRAQKARVEAELAESTSVDALARQARRIGRVRPGEQLFIVKGVDAWRRQNAASR